MENELRTLFTNKEKVECITFEELKQTVNAEDMGGLPKTRPVPHFKFIEQLQEILNENEIPNEVHHVYVGESSGNKRLPIIEKQYNQVNVLQAWILDRVTGVIELPTLSTDEMAACVAFSYHEKGLDLAFGHRVYDCSNMAIFGEKILHTYGSGMNVSYANMLVVFQEWVNNIDKLLEEDRKLIMNMINTTVTSQEKVEFIGELTILANSKNAGKRVTAPLNVSQVNEVIKITIEDNEDAYTKDSSLWKFYNSFTFVIKPGRNEMSGLLTDVVEIGKLLVSKFKHRFVEIDIEKQKFDTVDDDLPFGDPNLADEEQPIEKIDIDRGDYLPSDDDNAGIEFNSSELE